MADFEERQSEKVDEPDDGWTKVGKKKTVRLTEADQVEMRARAAKKRKKGELVSLMYSIKSIISVTFFHKQCPFQSFSNTLSFILYSVIFEVFKKLRINLMTKLFIRFVKCGLSTVFSMNHVTFLRLLIRYSGPPFPSTYVPT